VAAGRDPGSTISGVEMVTLPLLAPAGAALVVVVYVNGVVYATITVPAGATSASVTTSTQIMAGQLIRVDVTAVGTTYPGSDMTVFINP